MKSANGDTTFLTIHAMPCQQLFLVELGMHANKLFNSNLQSVNPYRIDLQFYTYWRVIIFHD